MTLLGQNCSLSTTAVTHRTLSKQSSLMLLCYDFSAAEPLSNRGISFAQKSSTDQGYDLENQLRQSIEFAPQSDT